MSKLYIIPTPIGNLEDITLRALRILGEVDIILSEHKHRSKILLNHYKIDNLLQSFHQHNEHRILQKQIKKLLNGETIALISDAGTPSISDAGFLLVRECARNNIDVECLPGATAFVPAIVSSALSCDRFIFEGFLPNRKGRMSRLKNLIEEERTMIFYESPYRVIKTLMQFIDVFGEEREASISREISKLFETTLRGRLKELLLYFQENKPKGEFVIIVAGKK